MKCSLIAGFVLIIFTFLVCGLTTQPNIEVDEQVCLVDVTSGQEELTLIPADNKEPEVTEKQTIPPHTMYYEENDIIMLAKLMYQECGGIPSDTEKACVAWTVLNRVDDSGGTISEVVTAPNQFAYYENKPVDDALYALAEDVLMRWNNEKNGEKDVGRVLPSDYLWFYGDGKHNHFRNAYQGNYSIWDYSLPSPYES